MKQRQRLAQYEEFDFPVRIGQPRASVVAPPDMTYDEAQRLSAFVLALGGARPDVDPDPPEQQQQHEAAGCPACEQGVHSRTSVGTCSCCGEEIAGGAA